MHSPRFDARSNREARPAGGCLISSTLRGQYLSERTHHFVVADSVSDANQSPDVCGNCGEDIPGDADGCPTCGERKGVGATGFTDQYSVLTWLGSAVVAVISFPFGLLVPAYFVYKARDGSGTEQGRWEVWAVLLSNIIGMAAVELAGETGGKVIVALNLVALVGLVFAAVLGAFVLGLGSSAQYLALPSVTLGM
jgi:hypothetical protein